VNEDNTGPTQGDVHLGRVQVHRLIESLTVALHDVPGDGKPCRATANVSLKELLTAKEQLEKKAAQLPGPHQAAPLQDR